MASGTVRVGSGSGSAGSRVSVLSGPQAPGIVLGAIQATYFERSIRVTGVEKRLSLVGA